MASAFSNRHSSVFRPSEATKVLKRVPVHMAYNVSAIDRSLIGLEVQPGKVIEERDPE